MDFASHPRITQPAACVISEIALPDPHYWSAEQRAVKVMMRWKELKYTDYLQRPRCLHVGGREIIEAFSLETGFGPVVLLR